MPYPHIGGQSREALKKQLIALGKSESAADEFQKKNPCFVIVPQYPYIEVDNQWQTGKQVALMDLFKKEKASYGYAVWSARLALPPAQITSTSIIMLAVTLSLSAWLWR